MATLASLIVSLGLDAGDYNKGLDKASDSAGKAGKDIGGKLSSIMGIVAGVGVGALGAGLAAMGGLLAYSTGEASEAQASQAQLAAVLESTGGIAGVTAEMANNLATSLSGITRFSDETVLEGENLLLTFTNIGKDVFPAATDTMLDMSAALGQDVSASAMQLGKALNDPIEGVTALKRVGVNFTDAQLDMIDAMVEAGDVAGAQKIILAELQTEFGGSAEAAGGTFAGQLDILKNSLSNVAEEAGMVLLPVLSDALSSITPLIIELANKAAEFVKSEQFREWLAEASRFIRDDMVPAITRLAGWIMDTLIPSLRDAWTWFDANIVPVLRTIGQILGVILPPIMGAFVEGWKIQIGILQKVKDWFDNVVSSIKILIDWIKNVIDWLGRIQIPPILTQHSPSPMEQTFLDLAEAVRMVGELALPRMQFETGGGRVPGVELPTLSKVSGMRPIVNHIDYHPFISTADEMEALNNLIPILDEWDRKKH